MKTTNMETSQMTNQKDTRPQVRIGWATEAARDRAVDAYFAANGYPYRLSCPSPGSEPDEEEDRAHDTFYFDDWGVWCEAAIGDLWLAARQEVKRLALKGETAMAVRAKIMSGLRG